MTFNPEQFYSVSRMPQRRSVLRAASRDYEVYFTNIESVLDKLREIFNHMIRKLVAEIQVDLPGHSHRIRLVLNAPTLNYPIHIPFSSADDFDADIVLNEIDRVVNSNEAFDISNNIKVNVLCVSLPTMGGKRIGGIHSRTVPDIKLFTKQKKSIIVIKSEQNDCLMRAIAIGLKITERVSTSSSSVAASGSSKKPKKNLHLDRTSTQTKEMQQIVRLLKTDPQFQEAQMSSSHIFSLDYPCTSLRSGTQTYSKPLLLQDLEVLAKTNLLRDFCISVYDSNFMGTFLKCYNPTAQKHIDLLYDAEQCHVDVITSMKGLFDARHFCYSCHKAFSTIKHLCAASGCMLCRQPGCLNRTGFINLCPVNSTQQSNKMQQFQCDRCLLRLRSQHCLDCHVTSGVCHLYTVCPSCSNTVPKRALSNHICSKKRCAICSVYYPVSKEKKNEISLHDHQCFVQPPKKESTLEAEPIPQDSDTCSDMNAARPEKEELPLSAPPNKQQKLSTQTKPSSSSSSSGGVTTARKPSDDSIWVFDIETDQSCGTEGFHHPILLAAESLTGTAIVYIGYDCINDFCNDVFSCSTRVRKTEWFIAHFGSGFDFLPILEWLYKQHKYIPKILLRGNKVVSMRVGNKRFIDSYLFIPIPLSKFAKTFSLEEAKKGYFPHFLTSKQALAPTPGESLHSFRTCGKGANCSHRQIISTDCVHCQAAQSNADSFSNTPNAGEVEEFAFKEGQFPPACLFALNSMKGKDNINVFLNWHEEQCRRYKENSLIYDFRLELIEYCQSDVTVLKEGFLEYRRLIKSICDGIDPFEVACTAASACNYIYRQLFMPRDSIAILPQNGYTGAELTSFPAALWLSWVEETAQELLRTSIIEAEISLYKSGGGLKRGKGKEQTLGSYKVDGLLLYHASNAATNTTQDPICHSIVLEFFGCYFHGCPSCYPDGAEINKKRNGISMSDLYNTTVVDRLNWIMQQAANRKVFLTTDNIKFSVGKVFYVWECEFNKLLELSCSQTQNPVAKEEFVSEMLPETLRARIEAPCGPGSYSNDSTFECLLDQSCLYTSERVSKLQCNASDVKRYSPLQPRDAFVGGRTENFVMQWSRKVETKLFNYVDVCSLYPFVNSRSVYPLGHPDLILVATEQQQNPSKVALKRNSVSQPFAAAKFSNSQSSSDKKIDIKFMDREHRCLKKPLFSQNDKNSADEEEKHPTERTATKFSRSTLSQYPKTAVESQILDDSLFGLIKCQVLPPSDLHLPILPLKYQAKLFFPLCRRCVEERGSALDRRSLALTSNKCSHSDIDDRSFWGTFVIPEVKVALENGYRIVDVAEIWSWSKSKRSVDLFKDYINNFLKIKMEASGWPSEKCCDFINTGNNLCDHKVSHLKKIQEREGISLDPQKIEKNEGLRFIAKILLNSFWGYLGMRDNMPKTRYINNYKEVVEYFTSRTKRVTDATLVGDDLMLLQYQLIDDAADAPRKTNVVLAAFTTAHARVILLNNMHMVKNPQNVLYCDTDSIMYVQDMEISDSPDINIGSGLGEMTNELPDDVIIDKFWSAGPKFYCLSGHNIKSGLEYNLFKVKGVTLNRASEKTFNPDTFRKLILGETHELRSPFTSLSRCVRTGKLKTRFCEKKARVTSSKRVFDLASGTSTPFGFVQ